MELERRKQSLFLDCKSEKGVSFSLLRIQRKKSLPRFCCFLPLLVLSKAFCSTFCFSRLLSAPFVSVLGPTWTLLITCWIFLISFLECPRWKYDVIQSTHMRHNSNWIYWIYWKTQQTQYKKLCMQHAISGSVTSSMEQFLGTRSIKHIPQTSIIKSGIFDFHWFFLLNPDEIWGYGK